VLQAERLKLLCLSSVVICCLNRKKLPNG